MKLTSAEAVGLDLDLSPDHRAFSPLGWRPAILKLVTDEGLTGIGEAGLGLDLNEEFVRKHGTALKLA